MTDQGLVRTENEDSFVARPDLGLFVVADGVGSSGAGALASALAVRAVERCFEEARRLRRLRPRRFTPDDARVLLLRAFARAQQRVDAEAKKNPQHKRMTTTLAAMVVAHDKVVMAHLGDSRVYRLPGRLVDRRPRRGYQYRLEGVVEQLTIDHIVANDPTEPLENRRNPALRLLITRTIGADRRYPVPWRVEKVGPDDTFVLCTDGLYGVLLEEQLAVALRYVTALRNATDPEHRKALPHAQLAWMFSRVKMRGASDNVTAIVVRFRKGRGRFPTQREIGCVVHGRPRDETWIRPPPRPRSPSDDEDDET